MKDTKHKKIRLSTETNVFINESLSGYYKLLLSKCKKLFLGKKIASFWVTYGTVKTNLLNDQVRSIIHEVDLSTFVSLLSNYKSLHICFPLESFLYSIELSKY